MMPETPSVSMPTTLRFSNDHGSLLKNRLPRFAPVTPKSAPTRSKIEYWQNGTKRAPASREPRSQPRGPSVWRARISPVAEALVQETRAVGGSLKTTPASAGRLRLMTVPFARRPAEVPLPSAPVVRSSR